MPRQQLSSLLRRLVPACQGDLSLAQRELAWLKEHVQKTQPPALQTSTLDRYIEERVIHHKPLQYILGTQPFLDLDILTEPPTLIPRWETEEWVHRLQQSGYLVQGDRILDICTGTGCIALALKANTAIDISDEAVALARRNAAKHGQVLSVLKCDVFDDSVAALVADHDVVVANPPYVTRDQYETLEKDVKHWEDIRALVADQEGLAVHHRIVDLALQAKTKVLAMEIGGTAQVDPLRRRLKDDYAVHVWQDLRCKDRLVLATKRKIIYFLFPFFFLFPASQPSFLLSCFPFPSYTRHTHAHISCQDNSSNGACQSRSPSSAIMHTRSRTDQMWVTPCRSNPPRTTTANIKSLDRNGLSATTVSVCATLVGAAAVYSILQSLCSILFQKEHKKFKRMILTDIMRQKERKMIIHPEPGDARYRTREPR